MNEKVFDAFGRVPPHVAPSVLVRRWDQALIASGATFLAAWPSLLWVGLKLPGPEIGPWTLHVTGALAVAFNWSTFGVSAGAAASDYLSQVNDPLHVILRVGIPLALSMACACWSFAKGLTPRSNTWHLSGPRLLDGKEALREARARSLNKKQIEADSFPLALHPALILPKKRWARHLLIAGSVGSGKTVILMALIRQMLQRNLKCFIYDVKGDFTAKGDFGVGHRPIIVSPFDKRSYVWDVARDVRSPTQAAAFAASLIPEESGNGKFWTIAAQQLLTGALRSLQNTRGTEWTWTDLAHAVSQGAPAMLPMLKEHYAKAAPLIANEESQSTASVLATLAGYTRVIDDLALAWPTRTDRMFAMTDWVKDSYKGRKQVIVQAGPDPSLTKAYIAAMINVAVPSIISAQLPDNEEGRFLGFILDELPSIGRLNIDQLLTLGRSKGVCAVLCYQDFSQMEAVYSREVAKTFSSTVATKIICEVQAGDTRDYLASTLGKHKVAWRTYDDNATVHEETRAIVSSPELTDRLGFRNGKAYGPSGWGIRAIVQMGGDPLLLNFPGNQIPNQRPGQVPARWTLGPRSAPKLVSTSNSADVDGEEMDIGLSMADVLAREANRIYGGNN